MRVRTLLAELAADRTVILATHIVADVAAACLRVAVLRHGRVTFMGSTSALAAQAQGQLWQATVAEQEVVAGIGERWPVARLTRRPEGTLVRVVATQPDGFAPVTDPPSVEEGYLAVIGQEALA